jgi:transcriptional regulator with XRE-family HTH domain
MQYMPANHRLELAQQHLVRDLGARLRQARKRRGLTAQAVADQAGITRPTLARLETGEAAVTLGTLVKVLDVLGIAADLVALARDQNGAGVLAKAPVASPPAMPPRYIQLAKFPVLKELAWHLNHATRALTPKEAFSLYERNWRHANLDQMTPEEKRLVDALRRTEGKGVMLV